MNASEIKRLLNDRVEDVCRLLLPAGKRDGAYWVVGDVNNTPGTSCKVHLAGNYIGCWKDFAEGDDAQGSIIDLWMRAKNMQFKDALADAAKWLGVDLRAGGDRLKTPPRSAPKSEAAAPAPLRLDGVDFVPVREGGAVWRYLTEERKLTPETLKLFAIGENRRGDAVAFPYYAADGKRLHMVKYIELKRVDGKKEVRTTKNPEQALFGKNTVKVDSPTLIITEGEIDAMTCRQVGFNAVSVPFGAKWDNKDGKNPNDVWIERDFDFLEQFTELYLCFDPDEPGRKACAGLAKRLGIERCLLMRPPEDVKDPNGLLQAGRVREMAKLIKEARSLDPEHLKRPIDFQDDVYERFYPKDGQIPGLPMPWPGLVDFRIRFGEVTGWQGYNGHGKSLCLNYCAVHWMSLGQRVCVASMEMPAEMTLQNMWRQCSAIHKPETREEFDTYYNWLDGRVWIYDRMGDVDFREVMSVFSYTARRYGVKVFVLDSLTKLGVAHDDYDRQQRIVNDLCAFAQENDAHVFLVCHAKKPQHEDETRIPGKYDISGSGKIADLLWNGVTIWRNKAKEEKLKPDHPNYEENDVERRRIEAVHDAMFICWKQRTTGEEPARRLWFDRESWQYHQTRDDGSTVYADPRMNS